MQQNYSYDGVNRLSSVSDSGYSRNFCYDAYGNGWVTQNSGVVLAGNTPQELGAACTNSYNTPYNPINNHIVGASYDACGNQTGVNGNTVAYDAESRQTSVAESPSYGGGTETYVYDGDGQRVMKSGPGGTTVYVYDALGQLAAEYSTAISTPPCSTCYLTWDHLGTPRLVTDQNGNMVSWHDYLPFGEEIPGGTAGRSGQFGATENIATKFTGKLRDAETGLDYFGSRYYGSALGRWTSPDRVNLTDDRILSPSNTINKYIYGGNNPLKFVDPDGEDITLFYTNGGPGGHAMLLAYNQQTGDSAVQSFGPANHSNATELKMFLGIPVPGTANYGFGDIKSADQLRQEYSSITIQTSPEETQKAIQYIRTHSDGNYDTYTNNCTTTCARILRDLKLLKGGPAIIPRDLFTMTAADYSKTKFINPWNYPQHGQDYGNPRPGYDPFDLLFFGIQQQLQSAPQPQPQPIVTSKICYDDDGSQVCQ